MPLILITSTTNNTTYVFDKLDKGFCLCPTFVNFSKMKSKKNILLLCVVILVGCSTENVTLNEICENSAEIITIPDEFDICEPMENLVDDLSFITLETTPESVLGEIQKVIATTTHIYVYDYALNFGPAVFDIDGNFVKRLSHGQGPQEIGVTGNILFDANSNLLCVYDTGNHKLVKFDKNGDFIDCHYLDYLLCDIVAIDSAMLSIQPSFQNPVGKITIIKDDTLNHNVSLWQIGKERFDIFKKNCFQPCDEGVIINLPYDNNVYFYKDGCMTVKYKIQNKSKVDLDAYEKEWDMLPAIGNDEYVYAGNCMESSNYLYLKYITMESIGPVSAYIFRNKKTKRMTPRIYKDNSIVDLITVHGFQRGCSDVFVGVIESSILHNHPKPQYRWDGSNPNNLISDEDMAKLRAIKPDDNPIIVLFKLKDDI